LVNKPSTRPANSGSVQLFQRAIQPSTNRFNFKLPSHQTRPICPPKPPGRDLRRSNHSVTGRSTEENLPTPLIGQEGLAGGFLGTSEAQGSGAIGNWVRSGTRPAPAGPGIGFLLVLAVGSGHNPWWLPSRVPGTIDVSRQDHNPTCNHRISKNLRGKPASRPRDPGPSDRGRSAGELGLIRYRDGFAIRSRRPLARFSEMGLFPPRGRLEHSGSPGSRWIGHGCSS
jgi:hypothetical protein